MWVMMEKGLTYEEKAEQFIKEQKLKIDKFDNQELRSLLPMELSDVAIFVSLEASAYLGLNKEYCAVLSNKLVQFLETTLEKCPKTDDLYNIKEIIADLKMCYLLAKEGTLELKGFSWHEVCDFPEKMKMRLGYIIGFIVDDEQYLRESAQQGATFFPSRHSGAVSMDLIKHLSKSSYQFKNGEAITTIPIPKEISGSAWVTKSQFETIISEHQKHVKENSGQPLSHPLLPEMVCRKQKIELELVNLFVENVVEAYLKKQR